MEERPSMRVDRAGGWKVEREKKEFEKV